MTESKMAESKMAESKMTESKMAFSDPNFFGFFYQFHLKFNISSLQTNIWCLLENGIDQHQNNRGFQGSMKGRAETLGNRIRDEAMDGLMVGSTFC